VIQLYAKGTTDFTKNGISLHPSESTVTFQDNGQYDLEIVVSAQGEYTNFDYGQILRATVPQQDLAQVNLGSVSYYTVSKSGGTDLYSQIPTLKRVWFKEFCAYKSWVTYEVGAKVTYIQQNYQMTAQDPGWGPGDAYYHSPDNAPQYWTPISNTTGVPGKVAAELDYGETLMKIRDFNTGYAEVATLDGKAGYVKTSDITATGSSGSRTVPARTIKEQNFMITEIRKEQNNQTIRVTAEHVSYQLGRTILGDCSVVNVNPATAILFIQGAMQESYAGNIYSNITDVDITQDWSWKNAQAAVLDPGSGLLGKTGGWIVRDNLDVFILQQGTASPKYSVRYGANMKSVKWTGDVGDIVTRIYPIAKTEDGDTLLLPEKYIDSVRTVPFRRPEVLDTKLKLGDTVKNSDGTETKLKESNIFPRMRKMANDRFSIDKCDQADVQLEVDWVHMPETEEYAEYTALANAGPGDWVEVVNGPLGISELIRMTGYTWDPMLERYKGAKFGANKEKATVAGYNLKNGSVGSAALAANSVSGSNLQQNTITAREIEAYSIGADRIATKSITAENIAASAVTAEEISANAVTAEKIAAGSVTTPKLAAEAVTAEKIDSGAVTADKIDAGAVNAQKIDAEDVDAINAVLGTADIADARIAVAEIGYGQIVDANIDNLIAHDAVTDRYYINKLAVNNAQAVYAQVGELVVKASDDRYYRLDIAADGSLSATDVTGTLTPEEIAAGQTADGRASIIETDLTAQDLSASNMKAMTALIAKITAAGIDVDELFARDAVITHLNTANISNNQSISLAVREQLGQGHQYMQEDEPTSPQEGDIWHKLMSINNSQTWEGLEDKTWEELEGTEWYRLSGVYYETYCYDGTQWQPVDSYTGAQLKSIMPDGEMVTGIHINQDGIEMDGKKYIRLNTDEQTNMELSREGISMETAGRAYLHAADSTRSAIIFGTDVQNASFAVDITGDMYSKSVTTEKLTLGGFEVPLIIVDANQPSGHNILWVKPSSTTGKQWGVYPDNNKINTSGGTLNYYRDFTIPYAAADYLAGNLYYGARVRLYVYDLDMQITPNVTLKARLRNGNSWIDLGDVTKRFYSPGYLELDNDLATLNTNVMNVSGGTFTVRIETNYTYNNCRLASENIVLRAMTTGGAGVASCDIYYIN
jgi:phage minor structural protein